MAMGTIITRATTTIDAGWAAMAALFDHYVIVDWSAANQPRTGRDSIWVCHRGPHGERVENPATRRLAHALLSEILTGTGPDQRVLLGFDFPFGYPAGFAARLGLNGTPWRAVWDEIVRLLQDADDNKNNRFIVGAELNRRVSGGRFPFWGCPVGFSHDCLGPVHHRSHVDGESLAEKRLIDHWMVGAQPCWKLAYTGSVGSQVLTGIPVVRALRDDPRWAECARVWPFETGLGLGDDARIVFAEVWPSWWKACAKLGPPNDKAQVRTVAAIFAARDRCGELANWFAPPVEMADTGRVIAEEAWTLGVMEPRQPNRTAARPSRPPSGEKAAGGTPPPHNYRYLREPAAIYRRSFALIRDQAELGRFPRALRPVALRLAHAVGDISVLDDLAWSPRAVAAGRRALAAGAPVLVDGTMLAAGIIRNALPARNDILCTLNDAAVPGLAAELGTTRSAAAVELWRPRLRGGVVAIGNAPTALFRLLELLHHGAPPPALVLGFPVGFVGAAEAKAALIEAGIVEYIALKGRRGGSALAAAAVNALAAPHR